MESHCHYMGIERNFVRSSWSRGERLWKGYCCASHRASSIGLVAVANAMQTRAPCNNDIQHHTFSHSVHEERRQNPHSFEHQ
eukprot:955589-Pelagomonas_calceolata.AAC.4